MELPYLKYSKYSWNWNYQSMMYLQLGGNLFDKCKNGNVDICLEYMDSKKDAFDSQKTWTAKRRIFGKRYETLIIGTCPDLSDKRNSKKHYYCDIQTSYDYIRLWFEELTDRIIILNKLTLCEKIKLRDFFKKECSDARIIGDNLLLEIII